MVSTACPLLCRTPFSAYSLKINNDELCQRSTFYPRRVARVASIATKQNQLVYVSDVKQGYIADPEASRKGKGYEETSGKNSPVAGSSGFSLSFLNIFSAWNVWLTTAAMLVSATIYRRMRRVEVIMENTEKTAEIAKGVINKAAEKAREIQTEVSNRNDERSITGIAFNLGHIAEVVEKNTQKSQEALKKVENLEMEVEELLEAKTEEGETGENSRPEGGSHMH